LASLLLASAASSVFGQTITTNGTVNSADYSRSFAPGAIISIFGTNLATSTATSTSFPLPTTLGGATVTIVGNGSILSEKLPIFYASPTQINAQIPYDIPVGSAQIKVSTSNGSSNADTITLATAAPKFFTLNVSGTGSAVATTPTYTVLTAATPAKAADSIVLWMNSLGPVTGTPIAGQAAPGATAGTTPQTLQTLPTVTINGAVATVTFAGLSPGASGLYQINIQAPFVAITGPVNIQVSTGLGVNTQANVTIPFRQLGFYYSLLGGKSVAGQSLNGVAGSTSALAYQEADQLTWGTNGYNSWTTSTGLTSSAYSGASGLAITLYNGSSIVYDNNGIESGTYGTFYNNQGGAADNLKPGLTDMYSMSNYFPLVFAGYFKLAQSTTITKMVGYFDPGGSVTLPFDPSNPYIKYRFNIWTNNGGVPTLTTGTQQFVGNTFSSDTTAGTFAYSDTNVQIVSSVATNAPKDIYRLTYTLATPITLPAGEYWLSHDASVRSTPGATSTSLRITDHQLKDYISGQKVDGTTYRFNMFGRDLFFTNSWSLPVAVQVVPSSPVERN
jgi:uncharacterized protein (TIGR03437 family)